MGTQLTSVERFDLAYKGLRLAVDLLLDGGNTAAQVAAAIAEQYKLEIPERTIANYTERRYRPRREQWEETLREKNATMQALKEYGAGSYTEALLMEQMEESFRRGERASMKDLLKEQRERERLALDKDELEVRKLEVENEKKALEAKLSDLEKRRQREIAQVQGVIGGAESSEKVDPDQVRKRIQEIFGIS